MRHRRGHSLRLPSATSTNRHLCALRDRDATSSAILGRYLASFRQFAHNLDQIGLALEADAGQVGQRHVAVLDLDAIGEAAEGLEQVGVALVAAESEAGRNVERHLVPAVRDAAAGGPAVFLEHVERAKVLDQAVAERAVEL